MKIVCEECGSKYSVDDSKVQNKSFKITCKKCGNKIIIDNTKKEEEDAFSSNESPFESQTDWGDEEMPAGMGADMDFDDQATKIMSYADAMKMEEDKKKEDTFTPQTNNLDFDDEATKIMSSSDASALAQAAQADQTNDAPEEDWYVHINGQQVGPLTLIQLQNKIKNEKLSDTTNVWKTGMADWTMIKSIPMLATHVVSSAAPDPFGASNSDVAAFGNDSLLDDNDAESLFNDKQEQASSASSSSFSNNNNQSDPFSGGSFGGGGLDLKSLIDQEDLEEDEEDDSSKSKVIDFRDIAGNNNKKIVVQHASFNASTNNQKQGGKGIVIALIAVIVLVLGAGAYYLFVVKPGQNVVKKEVLTKVSLESTPSGALIKLNGKLEGKTGGALISVKPGKYAVSLSKDGYKVLEDVIIVKKTAFTKKFTLKANPKEIVIKTGLVEADITVGTEKLKTDPNGEIKVKVLPASNIVVKVEKDGVTKISTTVNVTADGDSNFNLSALADNSSNTNTNDTVKDTKKTTKKVNKRTNKRTNKRVNKTNKKVVTVKKKDDLDDLFNDNKKKTVKPVSNLPKTLNKNQVLSVIKKVYPKVKACGKKASITGTVKVKFRINGSGSVSNIAVAPNGGAAKNCIYSKVRSMRFARFAGKPIPVTFPFKM